MTLSPGSKLGPYEILSSIGSGGMGEVWKAKDTRLGRTVAIKKVKEQHSERFKQEARSIAALNHPNICQIFDIGDDYLVLEYVEGKPLSSPLPEQEAVSLAIQIVTALEEAHQHGIIHRDLKPSNIMVTGKGAVKLLDFGLAKLYEQDQSTSNLPTEDFPATQAGAILGTVAYMSPEQAQGRPADARSDIFSFGLVLYEMLSGRRAFAGDSASETIAALLRDEPASLKTSPSLEKITNRCLEKHPSDRFQRMSELKVELVKATAKKAEVSSEEPQPSIAVLPFVNMSGDKEQEYFSDGLAEEIINALTKIPGLLVIARTSAFAFKGKDQDITEIAKALRVSNILEGSVRKSGNRIRVTAQLIEASKGVHLWSERYDRDLTDVFEIQDEIAASITGALKVKLSKEPVTQRHHEPNLAAHEAYLKARYYWGKLTSENLTRSKKYLEQAIALDPEYALAHCGLADHFLMLAASELLPAKEAMPVVRKEAEKALDIDPSLAEAHAMLGIVSALYDYDWQEAKLRFKRAMAYDPVPPRVYQWSGGWICSTLGRLEEAMAHAELGVKYDPLSVTGRIHLAYNLLIVGQLDEARAEAHKILELSENQIWASWILAYTYASQENWQDALNYAEKASPPVPFIVGTLAGLLKRLGEESQAEKLLNSLLPGEAYGTSLGLVFYYKLIGDSNKAADWMGKTIEQRHPVAPAYAGTLFRSSPRWPALAKLLNLPQEAQ